MPLRLRSACSAAALAVASLAGGAAAASDAPSIVVSIKPLHSLVAGVMAGVGEPGLILSRGGSEHSYSIRPSEAVALQEAAVVFWFGEGLETFLSDTLASIAADATVVTLGDVPGLTRLPVRTGATRDAHAHGGHDHDEHDHDHDRLATFDPHVWLDPANAGVLVTAIAEALAEADPAHAGVYRANAETTRAALRALDAEIAALLAPVAERPFVVFHDGYQYLEHRYGLAGVGAITVGPEVQPGAARLQEIRERIAGLGAVCVFAEPQYPSALVATVTEGLPGRTAVLDTLGAELENGPELYFDLMRANARSLADCLGG